MEKISPAEKALAILERLKKDVENAMLEVEALIPSQEHNLSPSLKIYNPKTGRLENLQIR